MKIYRYILLIVLSAFCASCTEPFDLNLDDDPVIFLEAFPGVEDMVVFKIVPAYSYSNTALKPEFKPDITFLVNGQRIPVVLNKDFCVSDKYEDTYYIADYKPLPGDKMSVEVSSEGFETIYAETCIPEEFPERKIDLRRIEVGKRVYDVIYVSFRDDEDSDLSYGLQICNETVYTYPDGTVKTYFMNYSGYQIVEDYEVSPQNYFEGMDISFNGWSVDSYSYDIVGWEDDTFNGKEKTLSTAVNYYSYGNTSPLDEFFESERDYEMYDDYGEPLGMGRIFEHNKLAFYTMSPEFYKYVVAQELISENAGMFAGIAPSNFCYSNVKNGYGAFAGVYRVQTDWITKEFIESNR